jgi:hypothetical protein
MARINVTRVIVAGLAAGVVANGLDFAGGLLIQDEQIAQAQRLNLDPAALEASFPAWIAIDFVYGLLLAFAYAAMRPRFGPGPRTAIIAGATLFVTVTAVLAGFMTMGMFTQGLFVKGAILSAVTTLAASLTAGALYQE